MKSFIRFTLLATFAVAALFACDSSSNRNASTRPFYQGSAANNPLYQNCGQSNYQYTNPYNNQQIYCQYSSNGQPSFYNGSGQAFQTDMYGNPCLAGGIDPTTEYCYQSNYYPMGTTL